jgi:uncharacterized protein DUF4112
MPGMAPEKVYIPEVLEPDEKLPPDLVALRKFAVLMDEAIPIPGTGRRVGLDAGIGLIPGIGDVVSGVMSAWIIAGALRHRVPTPKILRMVFNVLFDLLVGAVPIIGDLFDFVFEQNVMNMRLLMQHRNRKLPPRSTVEVAAAVTFVVIVIVGFALLMTIGLVAIIIWIANQRFS